MRRFFRNILIILAVLAVIVLVFVIIKTLFHIWWLNLMVKVQIFWLKLKIYALIAVVLLVIGGIALIASAGKKKGK